MAKGEAAVNRKRLGYALTGLGVLLAIAVGASVYGQVAETERIKATLPKARVVVATADIPARTEIAASMVNLRTVPDELVPDGGGTNIADVVGKFTPNPIYKGEVINARRIGPAAAKNAPSFSIDKGKVMYVVPASFGGASPSSIAQVNALRPGDRIDLLYTAINIPPGATSEQRDEIRGNPLPYLQTRTMLQNLRIQDIGTYAADGTLIPAGADAGKNGNNNQAASLANANLILVVNPEEALVLKWLKDAATYYRENNIEIVLRSPADQERIDPSMVVNFNYMRDKYNLAPMPPSVAVAPR